MPSYVKMSKYDLAKISEIFTNCGFRFCIFTTFMCNINVLLEDILIKTAKSFLYALIMFSKTS
jgi:hypothetical protein